MHVEIEIVFWHLAQNGLWLRTTLVATRAAAGGVASGSGLDRGLRFDIALGSTRDGLVDRLYGAGGLIILLVIAY